MADIQTLADRLKARFGETLLLHRIDRGEVTIEVAHGSWLEVCCALRDEEAFRFEQLSDLCAVDYSAYGATEWATDETTSSGFSRGVVERTTGRSANVVERYGSGDQRRRFGVVAHLLSYSNNWRLRVRTYAPDDELPVVPSLTGLWSGANWFEREAFDLFGVVFDGHDDLRRILTDYGFIGHPFRKDFPLIGHVEMRYDAERQRVIYQPVTIEPRVLVPRVVRNDHRYLEQGVGEENAGDA